VNIKKFDGIISPLNHKRFTEKTIFYFNNSYKSLDETYASDLVLMQLRLPQFHGGLTRKNTNWFSTIGFNSWLHNITLPMLIVQMQIRFWWQNWVKM
jgi:hypothetical protein